MRERCGLLGDCGNEESVLDETDHHFGENRLFDGCSTMHCVVFLLQIQHVGVPAPRLTFGDVG